KYTVESYVKNIIDFDNIVKLHYEDNISNEALSSYLENGLEHKINKAVLSSLEESDSKYNGKPLSKRDNCPWYKQVYCEPMIIVFNQVCLRKCGRKDTRCLKDFCNDQYNCYLD
ncbi:hypothetical protein H8356DRAFT_1691055, partial [Neocallimastix lanati (nom. inval.)]